MCRDFCVFSAHRKQARTLVLTRYCGSPLHGWNAVRLRSFSLALEMTTPNTNTHMHKISVRIGWVVGQWFNVESPTVKTYRRTRFAVGSLEFAGNPHRWHCNAAMEKQKRQLKLAHSANKLGSCNLKKYMCCTTRQLHGIISIRFNLLTKSTGIYIR